MVSTALANAIEKRSQNNMKQCNSHEKQECLLVHFRFIHRLNCFCFLKRAKTMVSRESETAENAGNVATIIGVLFYR